MSPILGIWASQNYVRGSFDSIATVDVGATGTSSVEFTSIPSTYTHLQIRAIYGSDYFTLFNCYMQVNSDTGNNYAQHSTYGDGSTTAGNGAASQNHMRVGFTVTNSTSYSAPFVVDILDYKDTNKYKTIRASMGQDANNPGWALYRSGLWMSTSAITSIKLYPQDVGVIFKQYSKFALYGIRSA